MNWVLSIIFLVLMFFSYNSVGRYALGLCGFTSDNFQKNVLAGFLIVFFLGFVAGLPSNVFHLSWNFFFITFLFLLFVIISISLYFQREHFLTSFNRFRNANKIALLENHFQRYWVIYVLVIVLSLLSMSNQMPYYRMNYDDSYYIGKIVQQTGIGKLLSEDFFNGTVISLNSVSLERYINTYEIVYGFFATVFGIYIPFFCRATMVIHNYIIVMLSYYLFTAEFVDKKYVQYSLVTFAVFFISFGLWNNSSIIRMYDGWQFQSAIFYGSSIVRVISLPVIIVFSIDLVKCFDLKKFIFLVVIYFSFVSFSTIFVQISIFVTFGLLMSKFIFLSVKNKDKKRYIYIFLVFLLITLLLSTNFIKDLPFFPEILYKNTLLSYEPFFAFYVNGGNFIKLGPVIILFAIILIKDKVFRCISIIPLIFYLVFATEPFFEASICSSFFSFFVSLRTLASLEHLLLLYLGIIFVVPLSKAGKICTKLLPVCSFLTIVFFLCLFAAKYDIISSLENDYLGSGNSIDGYSIERLVSNDKMVPELIYQLGKYYDELDYGNYRTVVAPVYDYDNAYIFGDAFVISSNRIEICRRENGCDFSLEELALIDSYFDDAPFSEINQLLVDHDVEFILVDNDRDVDELNKYGYKVTFNYDDGTNIFYLLKRDLQN